MSKTEIGSCGKSLLGTLFVVLSKTDTGNYLMLASSKHSYDTFKIVVIGHLPDTNNKLQAKDRRILRKHLRTYTDSLRKIKL